MKRLHADAVQTFFSLAEQGFARGSTPVQPSEVDDVSGGYERAYDLIRSHLRRSNESLHTTFFRSLARPLEIAVNLGHGSADAWWLFQYVRDALNSVEFVPEFDETEAWINALSTAQRYRSSSPAGLFAPNAFSRGAIVAGAFKRLSTRGFEYQITPYGVGLTASSLERACRELEGLVAALGGLTVATNIFRILRDMGKIYRGLFLFGRSVAQIPQPRDPTIPWHYLYNLALKHLTARPTTRDPATDWSSLVGLACDIGASMDAEEYYGFSFAGISPYLIDRVLIEYAVYDELFSFQQWSAEIASHLFAWWIDALAEAKCHLPLADPDEWRAFSRSLIARAAPDTLAQIRGWELYSLDLSADVVDRLLAAIAIPAGQLNSAYVTPMDTGARNAPFHPLINLGANRFVIPPRGLAARGLYERLFALMRPDGDQQLDRKLGAALERLTARILEDAGNRPSVVGGRYCYPNRRSQYDLDIAVESDVRLHLLECKRKTLTGPARGGGTIDAFVDLSQSFLGMLVQLTRHEEALRCNGSIKFRDGTMLEWKGREVERIAITMLDHGSFQNPIYIRNIVRAVISTQLSSDFPEVTERLGPVNETIRQLLANFQRLATACGKEFWTYLHEASFGTWWLSVDQLAVLMTDRVDLWTALRPIRHIVFQTGDLMNEFALAHRLASNATKSP